MFPANVGETRGVLADKRSIVGGTESPTPVPECAARLQSLQLPETVELLLVRNSTPVLRSGNVIRRQSPTFARSTMGRGLLPGGADAAQPVLMVSARSAKTNPFGIVAPRRFNMIA